MSTWYELPFDPPLDSGAPHSVAWTRVPGPYDPPWQVRTPPSPRRFNVDLEMTLTEAGRRILFPNYDDDRELNMEREDVIVSRIAQLEAELVLRRRFGRDTYDDGTVLSWSKTFPSKSDQVFRYAAVRVDGSWYLTGRDVGGHTWEQLIQRWTSENVVEAVFVMRTGGVLGVPDDDGVLKMAAGSEHSEGEIRYEKVDLKDVAGS